jgi:hypothetical protein
MDRRTRRRQTVDSQPRNEEEEANLTDLASTSSEDDAINEEEKLIGSTGPYRENSRWKMFVAIPKSVAASPTFWLLLVLICVVVVHEYRFRVLTAEIRGLRWKLKEMSALVGGSGGYNGNNTPYDTAPSETDQHQQKQQCQHGFTLYLASSHELKQEWRNRTVRLFLDAISLHPKLQRFLDCSTVNWKRHADESDPRTFIVAIVQDNQSGKPTNDAANFVSQLRASLQTQNVLAVSLRASPSGNVPPNSYQIPNWPNLAHAEILHDASDFLRVGDGLFRNNEHIRRLLDAVAMQIGL